MLLTCRILLMLMIKSPTRAAEEGSDPKSIAEKYIAAYFEDTKALNIMKADVHPKVTEHIADIIALVEKIIANGHAYVADGDVYFDVRSLPSYGELSGRDIDDLRSGARWKSTASNMTRGFQLYGKRPNQEKSVGIALGVRGRPAGISNAQP